MLQYRNCHVTYSDGVIEELNGALVMVIGESPNATARIATHDGGKYRTIDRILGASVDTKPRGGGVSLSGRSEHLRNVVGVDPDESAVTVAVKPGKGGCENC